MIEEISLLFIAVTIYGQFRVAGIFDLMSQTFALPFGNGFESYENLLSAASSTLIRSDLGLSELVFIGDLLNVGLFCRRSFGLWVLFIRIIVQIYGINGIHVVIEFSWSLYCWFALRNMDDIPFVSSQPKTAYLKWDSCVLYGLLQRIAS
jgi:hypothetical protein